MVPGGGERVVKSSLFKVICRLKLTIIRKKGRIPYIYDKLQVERIYLLRKFIVHGKQIS